MKKGYKFFTAVFIVGILMLTCGSAMASWSTAPGLKNVVIGASAALTAVASTTAPPVYSVDAAEALSAGYFVTLTLTGGALFSANPTADIIVVGASTPGTISFLSGGAGTASAKFIVSAVVGGTQISTPGGIRFNTTGASINVSNLTSGANVDMLVSIDNSSGVSISSGKSLFTAMGVYAFTGVPLFALTNLLVTQTVDVLASSGAYTKFEGNLTSIIKTNNQLRVTHATLGVPATALSAKKLIITLTGDFVGITKILTDGALKGSDAAGVTTGGLAGEFLINAAKTAAYATNDAICTSNGPYDITPVFYLDGTTSQAARSFTANIENLADPNYSAGTTLSVTKVYTIARNGTFFSANSLGPLNNIKISDLSGRVPTGGAKVLISAWDAAGTKLPEASGVTDILVQNNATVTISGAEFAARFVGTAMKYEVAVQSVAATLSNVKKDPTTGGITSTVYVPANTGGGAL